MSEGGSSRCGVTDDALWELLDATAPGEEEALRGHVESCDDCRRRLERIRDVRDGLVEAGRAEAASTPGRETLAAAARKAALDEAPREIGEYRILDVLGEGGMGRVYLAEQTAPIRRHVALKVVRPGMDSAEVVARFDAERQALALMSHPNIARVYGAGATPEGRPYFALEHVPGVSITEYCDRQRLDLRARIELFQKVCRGVQHAHQKGILHRDLKPSNVLVREVDGLAEPKIIDFGVAKALQQRLTEHTLYTEQGRILGTPEYMSPEQADLTALDVDTRSDIYSLGVMLYELLVGALPFDPKELRRAGYYELQRKILEDDPVRPSTRLSTLGDETAEISARRRTDRRALARALMGELDWITMRCLEKEPARRYASASELAADLQRHLDDEPVEAGPPSASYRLRKLLRRRRGLVVSTAAVVAALLGGLALAVSQARRALAAEDEAQENLAGYRRMRDVPLVEELLAEEEVLWPAHPELVPAMDGWLTRARALVERLPEHRAAQEDARARAQEPDAAHAEELRELARLREELARTRRAIERDSSARIRTGEREVLGPTDWTVAGLRLRAVELERAIAPLARRELRFDEPEQRFQFETLRALVRDLEQVEDRIIDVAARRDRAATLRARSVDQRRAEWEAAIAAIERADGVVASELYAGLPRPLTPQTGLVPIGMDEDSLLWEFAVLDTGELPARNDFGRLILSEETAVVLVLIPPGRCWLGAQGTSPDRPNHDPDADTLPFAATRYQPVLGVELEAFFLSKYELTQGQALRALEELPRGSPRPGEVYQVPATRLIPVGVTDWYEARRLVHRLGLELPTEARWEYAARAGTHSGWWTGPDKGWLSHAENLAGPELAKYTDHLRFDPDHADDHPFVAPVGHYDPNPFGLHDVLGNMSEWCIDLYGWYQDTVPRPGDGLMEPERPQGVSARGSGFDHVPYSAKVYLRAPSGPDGDNAGSNVGVRPARPVR